MDEARLVLARTIYGEARGEGYIGMEAVASVIMNRVSLGGWWGDEVIAVAMKPFQFSTWNENDPNRAKIENLKPGDDPTFDLAYEIAGTALDGDLFDFTGGATHYHATAISPSWADPSKQTALIGKHKFYTGIG